MKKPDKQVEDVLFAEKFKRLKTALDVKRDKQLAEILGITQQSVAGAKKRRQMPASWFETVGSLGVSIDYILFGTMPMTRQHVPDKIDSTHKIDPGQKIAEQLVELAIGETGLCPSNAGKLILEKFVKRKSLEDIKSEVIEMLKDVMDSERAQ